MLYQLNSKTKKDQYKKVTRITLADIGWKENDLQNLLSKNIFELKCWSGYSENLLQVLRYGQLFGNSDYDELNDLYRKYEKQPQVDLLSAHKSFFSLEDDEVIKKNEFNRKQHSENLLEYELSHYVLNTNHPNNTKHTDDMLREHKAAAYYPGWREKIQKLQKGD